MSPSEPTQAEALTQLIDEVRRSFHRLRRLAQLVHEGDPLTASRRGVMTDLLHDGPQTVPSLAKRRPVSRQHIQNVVNAPIADRHVTLLDNPAHKRSKLVTLTRQGRGTIERMLRREQALLRAADLSHSPRELAEATRILRDTRRALEELAPSPDAG